MERLRTTDRALEPASDRELLARLTEFDATFATREARAVALEASAGIPTEPALRRLERLQATGELLRLADGHHTTRGHRAAERHTVTLAARLATARTPPLPVDEVDRQALALDAELRAHGGGLSPEQDRALRLGCSNRRLVIIEGQAGTGKSTTLTAIARAHQSNQRQIVVTSTAALAAQRLATESPPRSSGARSSEPSAGWCAGSSANRSTRPHSMRSARRRPIAEAAPGQE